MGRFFNGGMEMMMVSVWVDGREGRGLKFFELTWTSVLWWGGSFRGVLDFSVFVF